MKGNQNMNDPRIARIKKSASSILRHDPTDLEPSQFRILIREAKTLIGRINLVESDLEDNNPLEVPSLEMYELRQIRQDLEQLTEGRF